jgi:NAD(P)H dehydrogenase (quinone)
MKVFIVYAHPSEDSLTRHVRDSFIRELESRESGWDARLRRAYEAGYHLLSPLKPYKL